MMSVNKENIDTYVEKTLLMVQIALTFSTMMEVRDKSFILCLL